MQAPRVELKKTRDFGEIVNDTFVFIRQNFRALVRVFFMYCGIFVVAGMISMIFQQIKAVQYYNDIITKKDSPGVFDSFSQFGLEYIGALLSMWFTYTLMTVSTIAFIGLYVEKGRVVPGNEELWLRVKNTFTATLGASVIWFILLAIGSLMCVIPGIYLFPVCSLFYVVLVIEQSSFGEAWNKSFRLIKNNWWTTFGVLFIMYLVAYFSTTVITLPATIINMIGLFSKGKPELSLTFTILATVLQYLCQVFLILPVIASCLSYYSLSEGKDGVGLMERISQFSDKTAHDERPESY
ncbi:hypothetical protein [Pedobacter sp. SYP-B3415]|uniref:hypothetical protein n=1 Tax=Pedobacter sp. SYP-B3415 TaxID=2496641 RepID=UPI00101E1A63|nr:hypothetical protein [Pedobacter sp. SYP-B3415]